MDPGLTDGLLMPLLFTGMFAFLSGGWTFVVGGGTPKIRRVWFSSVIFIFLSCEAMAWHKAIAQVTGFENAWKFLIVIFFVASIAFYLYLRKRATRGEIFTNN